MKDLQIWIVEKAGVDKLLHFAFGGWISCLGGTWYWALLIGFTIGLIKELFDKFIRKSQFSYLDWLATFLGSIVTAIAIAIKMAVW